MGWEVTCELCGKTEKHGIGCYCYYKEHLVNLERMKGANILDVILAEHDEVMLYKLQNGDETFYLWMNLSSGDEYHSYRRLHEITEADFLEMSKHAKEQAEKIAEEMKKFDEKMKETEQAKDEDVAKCNETSEISPVYDDHPHHYQHDYMCSARFPDRSHCVCGAPPSAWESDDEGKMPLEEEVKFVRGNIDQGETFSHCRVVGENDFHFSLIREDVTCSWYDIVMTKTDENSHVKKGDIVDVSVTGVDITDDETLGIFVQLVREATKELNPVV